MEVYNAIIGSTFLIVIAIFGVGMVIERRIDKLEDEISSLKQLLIDTKQ
jgi:uncharacterized iron-regulated membrane protein